MFVVIWRNNALDELADAYVLADVPLRTQIEQTVVAWNQELANHPTALGESRTGSLRIALNAPAAILFDVDHTDRVV
jgi:hypothetical protein